MHFTVSSDDFTSGNENNKYDAFDGEKIYLIFVEKEVTVYVMAA